MRENPKVHCLTNPVSMQDVANILLAAGGSAIMAQEQEEVKEITAICDVTLLNTGVPDWNKIQACELAGMEANRLGHPVVLDPVGAGASTFRKNQLDNLTKQVKLTVIRCNQEEAATLLHKENGVSGGVESAVKMEVDLQCEIAEQLAKKYSCAVLISGKTDVVSNGSETVQIAGGDARIARITGSGCMLSALCAFFCGRGEEPFVAAQRASRLWKAVSALAGKETDKNQGGIGTFHMKLFDCLEKLLKDDKMP